MTKYKKKLDFTTQWTTSLYIVESVTALPILDSHRAALQLYVAYIVERLFLSRIRAHVDFILGLNTFQSAYRRNHSTETAVIRILDDV